MRVFDDDLRRKKLLRQAARLRSPERTSPSANDDIRTGLYLKLVGNCLAQLHAGSIDTRG